MAERRFKVRVYRKAVDPAARGEEERSLAFDVSASNPDKAAALARARLAEQGQEVVSLSHAPADGIVVTLQRARPGASARPMVARPVKKGARR